MLNHIVLMGRLTRDPELRRTGSGVAVASFTLAVDRDYAAQGAEKETDFVDIVAWRSTAEFVSKYFSKGRMAVVSGRLQIRSKAHRDQAGSQGAEGRAGRRGLCGGRRRPHAARAAGRAVPGRGRRGHPRRHDEGARKALPDPCRRRVRRAASLRSRFLRSQRNILDISG